MALLKTITTKYDITVQDAYCRVENVLIQSKNSLQFLLKTYVTSASAAEFGSELHVCDYDLSGDNPIKQAYEYLKGLPEFAGATDC
jgi:hypothetical protein